MKPEILHRPCVPLSYIQLTIDLAAERGIARGQLLEGLAIEPAELERAETRFSLLKYTQIIYRAMHLSGDRALGYEFALRTRLTAHGFVGLGLMSLPTLRAAIEFGLKNMHLLTPCYSVRLYTEGEDAVVEFGEAIDFGPLRRYGFDMLMVAFARAGTQLMGAGMAPIELRFAYSEPDYFKRYADRLPPARFGAPAHQLRFPAALLDRPVATANSVTAKLVADQCAQELSVIGRLDDFVARVRAAIALRRGGYPHLDAVAARLHVSGRTLKRRLQEHGVTFQQLLDETRRGDSVRLLQDPSLTVEQVAGRLGFSEPANFTRAFRKWMGQTPSSWRTSSARPPIDTARPPIDTARPEPVEGRPTRGSTSSPRAVNELRDKGAISSPRAVNELRDKGAISSPRAVNELRDKGAMR